ncbi:ubiquinone/menaquinone biosynthesis C-methylase UbiE [Geomicrobium halophilum]|uniref:Ubiquinone/menaquinone biosynthesis C-methylase UbiE n=1 Tax=Geomicrobium halophilum TaxID=549000 RepID=A0A841Q126_9BACL|nr:class I SAM-dependent methyltransferase [Geomicrobium halophilum]MBB6451245.1 ubiquinone/menaquinone biosynthesis C-methylase UbiE [Geomicrobium halophilum]
MTLSFHKQRHRHMYTNRDIDPRWYTKLSSFVTLENKEIVDVGCGAGLYTAHLAEKGASITGVDFSEPMLETARKNAPHLRFTKGDAYELPFEDQSIDVVFARAVTHHLDDLDPFLLEAKRILRVGGHVVIQNRTPEDCRVQGSPGHVRGYLLELFPELQDLENKRRVPKESLIDQLQTTGFQSCFSRTLWEIHQVYPSVAEWADSIYKREGRSILHELSEEQLEKYVTHVKKGVTTGQTIIDQNRWTVFIGSKEN